jgi:hypothetical protein
VCVCVCVIHMYVSVCMYVCMYVCIYIYELHRYMYLCLFVCVCVCDCVCVYNGPCSCASHVGRHGPHAVATSAVRGSNDTVVCRVSIDGVTGGIVGAELTSQQLESVAPLLDGMSAEGMLAAWQRGKGGEEGGSTEFSAPESLRRHRRPSEARGGIGDAEAQLAGPAEFWDRPREIWHNDISVSINVS